MGRWSGGSYGLTHTIFISDNFDGSVIPNSRPTSHYMPTQRDVAISYLIAVGVGFFATFASGILYPVVPRITELDAILLFGLFCGFIIALGFFVSGVVLARSDLEGPRIWRIAVWGTVGLGIPACLALLAMIRGELALQYFGWEQVIMLGIAGGGIVGILTGTLFELRSTDSRSSQLSQRNSVFLRLFRHDIRNSLNVIRGQLQLLRNHRVDPESSYPVIFDRLDHILHLSEAAQELDEFTQLPADDPVNLGEITRERAKVLTQTYPDATVHCEVDDPSIVRANALLVSVVENLLRNAIEHNGTEPVIDVRVNNDEDWVCLHIDDNGPGFRAAEIELYEQGFETDLLHSDGIGLWLAHWIVESYGGTLTIENTDHGASVSVHLPAYHEG